MDAFAPINGISLERYAELAADVSETQDADRQADIVAKKGVARADWEAAKAGWTARMADLSLMGAVATRFMPLYQAELAKRHPAPSVGFEDYVAMSGAAAVLGYDGMLAHYKLTPPQWTQIAGRWNAAIPTNPAYAQYGILVQNEAARIRAGGPPKPVNFGAPSSPAVPAYPQPQPYPYAAQPAQPFGTPQQQHAFDRQLEQGFSNLGGALLSFGNAVGNAVDQTLNTFPPGARVFVQWSDGNRYPGTVMATSGTQVNVAFPDGRQIWVPAGTVTMA